MSKETIKMKSIRITRIGIKEVLNMAEQAANDNRIIIAANHRSLAKNRVVIRECQAQLRATKREIRRLNHQHDCHLRAIELAKAAK